jgi:hypothetical protein
VVGFDICCSGRLRGKRGSPETTWASLTNDSAYEHSNVQLTKEVFKVAIDEFLHEYARATNELIASMGEGGLLTDLRKVVATAAKMPQTISSCGGV